jgi:hypothetical protein
MVPARLVQSNHHGRSFPRSREPIGVVQYRVGHSNAFDASASDACSDGAASLTLLCYPSLSLSSQALLRPTGASLTSQLIHRRGRAFEC